MPIIVANDPAKLRAPKELTMRSGLVEDNAMTAILDIAAISKTLGALFFD